jgi:hypothetical protein
MSRRRNRRQEKIQRKNTIGILLIVSVAILLGVAFFYQMLDSAQRENIDKNTFCPKRDLAAITAVMIDVTDPLSAIQQASLKNELQKIRDGVNAREKLEIYTVGDTASQTLTPAFSMCNPGRGREANSISENPKLVEKHWIEAFDKPLEGILSNLLSTPEAKFSPILESLQSVVVTVLNNPNNQDAERTLIIASDMIHYTKDFSLYHPGANYQQLRISDYFRKIHSDMRNVKVEILLFRRTTATHVQDASFIKFWEDYFADQGATLDRIYSISG